MKRTFICRIHLKIFIVFIVNTNSIANKINLYTYKFIQDTLSSLYSYRQFVATVKSIKLFILKMLFKYKKNKYLLSEISRQIFCENFDKTKPFFNLNYES